LGLTTIIPDQSTQADKKLMIADTIIHGSLSAAKSEMHTTAITVRTSEINKAK
jgi:hypothetical protein